MRVLKLIIIMEELRQGTGTGSLLVWWQGCAIPWSCKHEKEEVTFRNANEVQ